MAKKSKIKQTLFTYKVKVFDEETYHWNFVFETISLERAEEFMESLPRGVLKGLVFEDRNADESTD